MTDPIQVLRSPRLFISHLQRKAGANPSGSHFVLLVLITLGIIGFACLHLPASVFSKTRAQKPRNNDSSLYGPATQVALLKEKSVKESSGIVASRNQPGVYWTHNDSGDGPFIYAFDTGGNSRGVWRVTNASAKDWEDIATGPGPNPRLSYLYIGDIGDNRGQRDEVIVYRFPEPAIGKSGAPKANGTPTAPAEEIRFNYPDGKHDAEALLVHPKTGDLYIVTKVPFGDAGIYKAKAPLSVGQKTTLNRLKTLSVPSLMGSIITGGAISHDGRRVVFCDYIQGYELVLENSRASFDEIWSRPLNPIDLGKRAQGEAITYRLDNRALLMTSEGSPMPLTQVVRR